MLRGNYQEVIPLAKKAIVFYERQGQKEKVASCKKFLGHSYFQINQKKLALRYLNEAEADIDESEKATLFYYLSAFYLSINDNSRAQKFAIDGFELAKKQNNISQLIEGYSALAFVYTKQKNIPVRVCFSVINILKQLACAFFAVSSFVDSSISSIFQR